MTAADLMVYDLRAKCDLQSGSVTAVRAAPVVENIPYMLLHAPDDSLCRGNMYFCV